MAFGFILTDLGKRQLEEVKSKIVSELIDGKEVDFTEIETQQI